MMESSPNHCNHFVSRKKRYCRMTVKPGERYCGEHKLLEDVEDANIEKKIRVVCPLDRKHTCYAHNLKKHLKICNARDGLALSYIQKGINSGKDGDSEEGLDSHKLLSTYSVQEIVDVIKKINKIFEECVDGRVTPKLTTHAAVEAEIARPEHGAKSRKHLKQASAILGLMDAHGLVKPETCYVEFGAGRGQISYWMAQVADRSVFLLVEKSSPKHKRDNKLDKSDDKVRRIRADIADLVLDKVEAAAKVASIVGVTKHLCGDATDLAIRCLSSVQDRTRVSGCIMTFCCHHRCRWTPYTGKDFFRSVGLNKLDFDIMCGMSSWATCGTGFSRKKNAEINLDEVEVLQNDRDKEIGLTRLEKEEVGKRSKNILNFGRLKYLEDLGFKTDLYYYVDSEISLENVCIVARRSNK